MLELSQEILENYQIRKTKKQKTEFKRLKNQEKHIITITPTENGATLKTTICV